MSSIRSVLIFLTFFSAFLIPVFSQQDQRNSPGIYSAGGIDHGRNQAMDNARELMVTAADLDTTFVKANFEAGQMHLKTIGKDLAVKYFCVCSVRILIIGSILSTGSAKVTSTARI